MQIKEGFRLRSVGKEYIVTGEGLAQVNFNKLISLNTSAAYLWKEVEGKQFDERVLANLLMSEYDVSEEEAINDATDVIKSWLEVGIIEK